MRASIFFILFVCSTPLFGEADTKYVWSIGYAHDSDIKPADSKDPSSYINPEKVKKGDVIWIQSHYIPTFYKEFLPRIKEPFILVTTDGDEAFPSTHAQQMDIEALIQHEKVMHIFAQNCDYAGTNRDKVSPIPIGLDFHTLLKKNSSFKERQQTVEKQEKTLEKVLSSLKPTHQRLKMAFVDFQLHDTIRAGGRYLKMGEDRKSIFEMILPSGVVVPLKKRIPRKAMWKIKGNFAFSIAPQGNGMDTHRLWEDLVLGCIVIVKTSPLDPLYEGLPVVIVKDWSEINRENFDKWIDQYQDAFTNPRYRERLSRAYWKNKICFLKN